MNAATGVPDLGPAGAPRGGQAIRSVARNGVKPVT